MTTRRQVFRRTASVGPRLLSYVGLPLLLAALTNSAAAESPSQSSPFGTTTDLRVTETSWFDEDSVLADKAAAQTEEMPLADRVAALEKYISDQEAAAEEPVPAVQDSCKQIEIITKPFFTPGGRLYFDGVTYDDDDATAAFFGTDRNNEFGIRTFRLSGKGNIYENLEYSIEVELRGTDISYKDIYMQQTALPVIGNFRAGHFKEPIGLEEFGSDKFGTFMEKTLATSTFCPSRNFGVMMYNRLDACDDATWFAGLFRSDSPDVPVSTGLERDDRNDWSFSTRLAWLPYYDEPSNGRYLVHVGGSYSYRNSFDQFGNQNTAAVNQNGLVEFSPKSWVGTQGPIGVGAEGNSDEWNVLASEFLVIWGSVSFQAEYFHNVMTSGEEYNGAYAFVSYFLTGENRAYKKDTKVTDRTIPFEPAFWIDTCKGMCCGRGAWELATGYSYVDLEDGHDITATRQRAFVDAYIVGLNWYHNPWSRIQINYEHEMTDFVAGATPDSAADIFGVRWAIDW